MRSVLVRVGLSLFPMALTPAWGYLLAEGHLNFGGGEKDLLLLIPWLAWSLFYLAIFSVCWVKRLPLGRTLALSAAGATVSLGLMLAGLFAWSAGLLGVSRAALVIGAGGLPAG